ncbi:head-tail adaptor protein [Phaeobacter gallaeciensis]|uniref:Phage head-tail joining protein n=1 Tax=Phaeobacter gallaeciensis TaxID=60890 RepID=A0AAC9Z939_9RHOB|nr:head-tail adaptor protein [Phaeobacter gallaeciensis]AHD09533.1 Phage head-tail joining protein [Phaeobacter gallaeciensis DSM 26640]ATE92798.1 Phage head-tail joining protein [Phaeobacter gallaeciensis]ATE97380.1 Phage head-tail joining protein [Phaeobacter gallaeciensis]ATF01463.1 Phage head-tail joining protein [Phaeobacter gallaeciensis]ATF05843.1 Phage head-tail joining protein [Phaeobacter gallaeciensis]
MLLTERVAFEELVGTDDGFGGKDWTPVERLRARAFFQFLRGGESVQAARLTGRQTIVATIRQSPPALAIKTKWQMRDIGKGITYDIRAIEPNRDKPRQYLDIVCESLS